MNNVSSTFGAIYKGSNFDPSSLNPRLWYDIRLGQGSLFIDGSFELPATEEDQPIVAIADKGSSGINAVTSGGVDTYAPLYKERGLSYDGSNDVHILTATLSLAGNFTAYLVFERGVGDWSVLSSNGDRSGFWGRDNVSEYAFGGQTVPRIVSVADGPTTSRMVARFIRNGTSATTDSTLKITGNDTVVSPSAIYSDTNAMTHLGYAVDTGYNVPSNYIKQILIWNRVLDATEQSQVESWITSNFGVSLGA